MPAHSPSFRCTKLSPSPYPQPASSASPRSLPAFSPARHDPVCSHAIGVEVTTSHSPLSPLFSTLACHLVSAHSKGLSKNISPFFSTLTENQGAHSVSRALPYPSVPPRRKRSIPFPLKSFRTLSVTTGGIPLLPPSSPAQSPSRPACSESASIAGRRSPAAQPNSRAATAGLLLSGLLLTACSESAGRRWSQVAGHRSLRPGKTKAKILFAFSSPTCYFPLRKFSTGVRCPAPPLLAYAVPNVRGWRQNSSRPAPGCKISGGCAA